MKLHLAVSASCVVLSYLSPPHLLADKLSDTAPIYKDTDLPLATRAQNLLEQLSIEQKSKLVLGTGFSNAMGGSQKIPGAAGATYAIPELGIAPVELTDGPAGVRINPTREGDDATYYATAFPIATALASTWNPALVSEVGQAMGNEVKEYGADILLGPALNIQLNPLAGRNYEYFSEDPLLSGDMAAAIVNGIQREGVGATLKHFAANNVETSRMVLTAEVDEQALREIYLKGFRIALQKSQPWAVMTSYNKLNGTYTSQDPVLLNEILRNEWGFDGLVMSDWLSGDDSVAQLQAGNDLIMPGQPKNHEEIAEGLAEGRLTEADLDKNLLPILETILKSPSNNGYAYSNTPNLTDNAQVARRVAAEGVILLKNTKATLPLNAKSRVAVFGNTSYNFISGGTGSGDVNEAYTVSLVEALKNNDLGVDQALQQQYSAYIEEETKKLPKKTHFFQYVAPIAEMPITTEHAASLAKSEDLAIITLGRKSGEFQDRQLEGGFYLNPTEHQLIDTVSEAFHQQGKKVVVILNIGNVIDTASRKNKVDAIVLPWQGGQEAGNAVVDVLTGKVNPSGKLAVTFPNRYEQLPSAKTFPGEVLDPAIIQNPYLGGLPNGQKSQLQYIEGIYVGYRYFDTFKQPVSFPFGFGLSYTDFSYKTPTLKQSADGYQVSVTVTNTGDSAGKQVLQVYAAPPAGKIAKPEHSLIAYGKTGKLKPGESETVSLEFSNEELASFYTERHQWLLEAGKYTINLSTSSRDRIWKTDMTIKQHTALSPSLTPLPPTTEFQIIHP